MTAIVDAHAHIWDPRRLGYPWLKGVEILDRPLLPADLDRADGRVTAAVFVQAGCQPDQALEEAHWVANLGIEWPELAAIVAAADLRAPRALIGHLDALADVDTLVGVRHVLHGEPRSVFASPDVRESLALLADRGLTFDACVTHTQLPLLIELIAALPELNVVLDHLGKPPIDAGIKSGIGQAWMRAITELAAFPRTTVKVSGLTAEATSPVLFEAHANAFIAHAVSAFGTQRAMIGSDWPVSRYLGTGGSFTSWVDRVRSATGVTGPERASIEHDTARRFYRLTDR